VFQQHQVEVPQREKPICQKCRKPMRLMLVKAMPGRKYQCIDCDGEDPLRSPAIGRLLQLVPSSE
jgi:hypothetical protein